MGVSGVGKTTVAKGLSTVLGWTYAEGDAFHSEANVEKMAAGTPLTDDDRWPWLEHRRLDVGKEIAAGASAVVTCSALRRVYRDLLREGRPRSFLHVAAARPDQRPDGAPRRPLHARRPCCRASWPPSSPSSPTSPA